MARSLNLSLASVSRQLDGLEEHLRTRLLVRTTRHLAPPRGSPPPPLSRRSSSPLRGPCDLLRQPKLPGRGYRSLEAGGHPAFLRRW
jgi:hypothetical protein